MLVTDPAVCFICFTGYGLGFLSSLIFSLPTSPAASFSNSHASVFEVEGVEGGDDTSEDCLELETDSDQLADQLLVDQLDCGETPACSTTKKF